MEANPKKKLKPLTWPSFLAALKMKSFHLRMFLNLNMPISSWLKRRFCFLGLENHSYLHTLRFQDYFEKCLYHINQILDLISALNEK